MKLTNKQKTKIKKNVDKLVEKWRQEEISFGGMYIADDGIVEFNLCRDMPLEQFVDYCKAVVAGI